jgi:hypothetical protein
MVAQSIEPEAKPGVFRWRYLRGDLARGDHASARESMWAVTLDQNGPVLMRCSRRQIEM